MTRELRGGSGYARARELLDSGAALKQMHKIIEAQGPSNCRSDVGARTVEILRSATAWSPASTACVSVAWPGRQARRWTRAPASEIFKKMGDRVEQESHYTGSLHMIDSENELAIRDREGQSRLCHRAPRLNRAVITIHQLRTSDQSETVT